MARTFFGGTIAIADLGFIEMCRGPESDLSPLTDRRNACDCDISIGTGSRGCLNDQTLPS